MRRLAAIACSLLFLGLAPTASAQDLPRSIKIVVPFPAGGTTDILARYVAQSLEIRHGITVIVDNRAGASGVIGSQSVAAAPPDGSVLLLTATHHVINPSLRKSLPYDTRTAFSAVAVIATAPNALVVGRDFAAKNVGELIAMAKAQPGKLSFASSGVGGANHLSGELFKQMAGVEIVHVPYKGAAPAMNDLIGGHVPIMFDTLPTVIPGAAAGTLRVLAVTGRERAATLPDVPTLDEAGLKGFEATAWFGLYMPRAGESAVYGRLVTVIHDVLADPAIKEKFASQGVEPGKLFGAEFAKFVDAEIAKWGRVVAAANLQPE
ncbi:tripartite tricarboxylate transporter substrate binding protein [Bradyrhizobium neotropicale]|uniref:tripartite tricarboxylate transporter substrate binding protein n=1 Tax=Bradyrhizobium neotropicale TaxID=1497615 RepID=UPI001AD764DC|nr:tripartite tricarboxylate transporter substrate binding protein [Bradyrhizobium neotropicale]MBO4225254.1 tripartite tricarboxylate transporter substrate binding protein [Bradyrhizobium neotropicale]